MTRADLTLDDAAAHPPHRRTLHPDGPGRPRGYRGSGYDPGVPAL